MRKAFITQENLSVLSGDLERAGRKVVVPRPSATGRMEYGAAQSGSLTHLGGALPARSLKATFLPPTEALLRWKNAKDDVVLEPSEPKALPTVVLGARPCDAAALAILDKVMDWDYHDDPWFARRKATTIVSLACDGVDSSCFCTSVGLSPDTTKGSDVLLTAVDGGYLVEALSEKGEALLEENKTRFTAARGEAQAAERRKAATDKVRKNLAVDARTVKDWLGGNFEHPFFKLGSRCHACGACAAVCPTCHCFDIVDEPEGLEGGTRRRNWDTCQTSKFTLHGSGHNPRNDQHARLRQRVMHKFHIYSERFGETLCTGCGRCARACPGGMDLLEALREIDKLRRSSRPSAAPIVTPTNPPISGGAR
ncbi:MAG: 4Fe-4S dicluster domain-containing protein [Myxococcota bacterium]|jgi:ferredoxin|nr:4Fe-4S dicluster domain-containing protein [Myxococcota bacterium]